MFEELNKYKKKGHFFLKPGEEISKHITGVPHAPGVFYALRLANGRVDLVYIGKSGVTPASGLMNQHDLRFMMLCNSEGCMLHDFQQRALKENIEALDVYWCVTYDKANRDLPSFVYALLMQPYFDVYGKLPPWNESF